MVLCFDVVCLLLGFVSVVLSVCCLFVLVVLFDGLFVFGAFVCILDFVDWFCCLCCGVGTLCCDLLVVFVLAYGWFYLLGGLVGWYKLGFVVFWFWVFLWLDWFGEIWLFMVWFWFACCVKLCIWCFWFYCLMFDLFLLLSDCVMCLCVVDRLCFLCFLWFYCGGFWLFGLGLVLVLKRVEFVWLLLDLLPWGFLVFDLMFDVYFDFIGCGLYGFVC